MRRCVALLALVAMGCSTSWQRIPTTSIKNNDAELLFVVTDAKAYVLVGSRFEADIVHGVPSDEWDRDPNVPVDVRHDDSPEDVAARSHWTRVVAHAGDVRIPFRDIRYSSVGDPPSGETHREVIYVILGLPCAIVGALWIIAIATN